MKNCVIWPVCHVMFQFEFVFCISVALVSIGGRILCCSPAFHLTISWFRGAARAVQAIENSGIKC